MGLKCKIAGLIFTACLFIPVAWAGELTLPLPKDALKVSEKTANFGPIKTVTRIYQSTQSPSKIEAFYKKEMPRAGWQDGRAGVFTKDNYMVIVTVDPAKDKTGKIYFTNTISNIPKPEEFSALNKVKPVKLDFMPAYPGSVQRSLWDIPFGVTGAYETDSSVKEVVFFYKSGMLDYEWNLKEETPIKTQIVDCPQCQQVDSNTANNDRVGISGVETTANLVFSRNNNRENCRIMISNVSVVPGGSPVAGNDISTNNAILPSKTTIEFNYTVDQRIENAKK